MRYMQDLMARMMDVPLAHMFVLASLLFLLVAVLGRIEGKIEPGNAGRIGATLLGVILMFTGLAMHFNETDALRDKMRESMGQSPSAPARYPDTSRGESMLRVAVASQVGVVAMDKPAANTGTEGLKSVVKVVTGTYGGNCGAKPGNATAQVARVCDGQAQCEFNIDPGVLEDPSPNCTKNFSAEWVCSAGGAMYTVSLPAGAKQRDPLRLVCSTH
ncbi:MAG: SUEL-type lectin domain-containing protein [Sulfuricaulis sp.]|nr:SUEL-type lectin domain-containing protein [Sulfuricaulis sp.]